MPPRTGKRILLVAPGDLEQREIQGMLEASGTGVPRRPPFEVVAAPSVEDALALLSNQTFDVALLSIPAGAVESLGPVGELRERHRALPVVLILDRDDEKLALEAAARGVQDCIVRNELVGNLLARSLEYAMERQELRAQLERRSVVDELTGLYNRRGFFAVGEQELRRARRKGDGFLLVFLDLDGLKTVNDREGHEAGDRLIRETAAVLTTVFRETDILARLGGDEFAVIAHQTGSGGEPIIRERLGRELAKRNRDGEGSHTLSLSVGIVEYDPPAEPRASLDELLSRADALMYEEKQRRHRGR